MIKYLDVKVCFGELQRVQECRCGRQPDVITRDVTQRDNFIHSTIQDRFNSFNMAKSQIDIYNLLLFIKE